MRPSSDFQKEQRNETFCVTVSFSDFSKVCRPGMGIAWNLEKPVPEALCSSPGDEDTRGALGGNSQHDDFNCMWIWINTLVSF